MCNQSTVKHRLSRPRLSGFSIVRTCFSGPVMKIQLKLNFNPLSKAVECFRKCLTYMEVKFSKSEVLEQVTHFRLVI